MSGLNMEKTMREFQQLIFFLKTAPK